MDLQRRSIESDTEVQKDYYFPKEYFADYESVVTSTKNASLYVSKEDENKNEYKFAYNGNLYKYFHHVLYVCNGLTIWKFLFTCNI